MILVHKYKNIFYLTVKTFNSDFSPLYKNSVYLRVKTFNSDFKSDFSPYV